jgi:hypothetical protein
VEIGGVGNNTNIVGGNKLITIVENGNRDF